MDLMTVCILGIIFLATLVRSTFGFGESLIAVPLLILFIPIEVAVPFSVLVSILIAAIVVVQDHTHVYFRTAKWLLLFAVGGIPIGLSLLMYGDQNLVKAGLGIAIVSFSLYSLFAKKSLRLKRYHRGWLFLCGFFSGVLGGAYGLNGPPLVVYGGMRRWSPQHFRATLQAYFLPASMIGMFSYWYEGLWTTEVTEYFLISLPVIIPAVFVGRLMNGRVNYPLAKD